jgi:gluconate 2-dehydrogenase gamma chain
MAHTTTTRREFLKIGAAAAGSALLASAIEIPILSNDNTNLRNQLTQTQTQLNNANQQLATSKSQAANLQNQVTSTSTGFVTLNITEQFLVAAIASAIIPSDANGAGAKEAGVVNFIDRKLAGEYGLSGNMFMDGPHIMPNQPGPITVNALNIPGLPTKLGFDGHAITYKNGTMNPRVGAGTRYQYPLIMREYWRIGLAALQNYATGKYGGGNNGFEKLAADQQLQALKDLWAATDPAKLDGWNTMIVPSDFAYELTFMTWAGFLMDPIHGGNQNMVGWQYTGFNGVNFGNFYGEGKSQQQLMLDTTPTRLKPASLAQYQQKAAGGA